MHPFLQPALVAAAFASLLTVFFLLLPSLEPPTAAASTLDADRFVIRELDMFSDHVAAARLRREQEAEVGIDGSDVKGILFSGRPAVGELRFSIDDVAFR